MWPFVCHKVVTTVESQERNSMCVGLFAVNCRFVYRENLFKFRWLLALFCSVCVNWHMTCDKDIKFSLLWSGLDECS